MKKSIGTVCDKRGRIYLSQDVRRKYGRRFVVVEVPGEIILVPVPEDPIKELEEIGKPLRGKSIRAIKKRIIEQAEKEVRSSSRRH